MLRRGLVLALAAVREGLRTHLGLGAGDDLLLAQDVRAGSPDTSAVSRERDEAAAALGLAPPYLCTDLDSAGRAELRGPAIGVGQGQVELEAELDGRRVALGQEFELDLDGVERLSLHVRGEPGAQVVLGELQLLSARRNPPPLTD